MKRYVIGLDQGTTGTTALLIDASMSIVDRAYQEHRQIFPKPGWVEHDPSELFLHSAHCIAQLLSKNSLSADAIEGIGIANQRETVLVWDRLTSKPIYPAIVWQCRRTADVCNELKRDKTLAASIRSATGLTIDPYFSATKLQWLLHNYGQNIPHTRLAFGTVDTWLLWNFTRGKVHATDFTNASRTLLFDIQKKEWSKSLCELFNVPEAILPKVHPSMHPFGSVDSSFFGKEIPIFAMAGDQQASLFGHGVEDEGAAKCTFGTGGFAMVHCGPRQILSEHGLLTTLVCGDSMNPHFALEGSIFTVGSVIQWLRDQVNLIHDPKEMDQLAKSIPSSEGVYLVPAFAGLGAPYWNSNARAIITGLHLGATKAHLARAVLESIGFQVMDLMQAFSKDVSSPIKTLSVDGGVSRSEFLIQFLADLLRIPILTPPVTEMTGFGAAKLAAKKLGWKIPELSSSPTKVSGPNQNDVQQLKDGWEKALRQCLFAS